MGGCENEIAGDQAPTASIPLRVDGYTGIGNLLLEMVGVSSQKSVAEKPML